MDRGAPGKVHRAGAPAAEPQTPLVPTTATFALTFDDGPSRSCTGRILDVLAEWKVQATFFVLGKNVKHLPNLVRRMVDEGHTVGNHGYSHSAFRAAWDMRALEDELQRCQEAVWEAAGVETALYRPPHGNSTPWSRHWLRRHGWTYVGWDVSGRDWLKTEPSAMARHVVRGIRPGSIVLFHDGAPDGLDADREATVQALPLVLAGAMEKGITAGDLLVRKAQESPRTGTLS